jgi:predicted nucleic acid-binding protein
VTFYFLDTSALVKRYHLEPGSDRVNAIFDDTDSILVISELAIVELASALQRKRSRREITLEAVNDTLAQFAADVLRDLIVAAFRTGYIQQARDLVLQLGLRALDALHLASASELSALSPVFVCADAHLRQAASDLGLDVLDPEATP